MTRIYFSFILLFLFFSVLSQTSPDLNTIVGTWKFFRADITIENRKGHDDQQDTSGFYTFRGDSTYSLFGLDLWGKCEIKGKWKITSDSTIKLYNIVHVSEVKGELLTSVNSYELVLKKVNKEPLLYLASYDRQLDWFHELYYRRAP